MKTVNLFRVLRNLFSSDFPASSTVTPLPKASFSAASTELITITHMAPSTWFSLLAKTQLHELTVATQRSSVDWSTATLLSRSLVMSYKHVIIVRCGWLQSGKLSRPHVHMKARTCAHTHTHKRTKRESRDNEQQQTKIEASGDGMRTKTLPYLQNNG